MDVDRDAPVIASSEIEIEALPEVVWDTLTDFESWPRWQREVKSLTIEGPVASGTSFRWKSGPASLNTTLQEVERPRRIGWTGRTMGIFGIHTWSFEPRDGGTTARTEESFQGLPARLLRGRMRRTLQRALEAGLAELKAEAERRASGA
jgi:uncharacterized protein YndB with AHSA1/START domain